MGLVVPAADACTVSHDQHDQGSLPTEAAMTRRTRATCSSPPVLGGPKWLENPHPTSPTPVLALLR